MKIKSILGLIAGAFLILSAVRAFDPRLEGDERSARADQCAAGTRQGLRMGWVFGGPVMLVFGILCISTFLKRFRGDAARPSRRRLIAIAYIGFGAWAAIMTGGDPFIFLFLVPGTLLAIASIP